MEGSPLFKPGHTACAGCGQAQAARLVIEAAGSNTIVVNNTGCLEVFSTGYPETAWGVPWIHSLFENAAAVASGVEAALIYLGKKDTTNVIAQGGDGSTADIGLQALSGMLERGHDILYVCLPPETELILGDGSIVEIGKFVDNLIAHSEIDTQRLFFHCEKIIRKKSLSYSNEGYASADLIIPVKDIGKNEFKRVEIVPATGAVLSWDKTQFLPMNMICAQRKVSDETLIKITTASGQALSLTGEHQVLIDTIDGPKWQRADLLKPKDEVYAPRRITIDIKKEESYIVDFLDGNIKIKLPLEIKEKINQRLSQNYGSVKNAAKAIGFKYWQMKEKNRMIDLEGLKKIFREVPALNWEELRESLDEFGVQGGSIIKIKEKTVTADLMYLLGLISSDGSLGRTSYAVSFINKEEILIKEFKKIYSRLFSGRKISEFRDKQGVAYLVIANPILSLLAKRLQIKSDPKELIKLPNELISAFLRGYFDGDGYCGIVKTKHSYDPRVILSTVEEKLAKRLRQMLQRLGIACFQVDRPDRFDLVISSKGDIERFINEVFSNHPRQKIAMKKIKKLWKTRKQRGRFFSIAPRVCGKILKDICEKEKVPVTKLDKKRNICTLACGRRRATKERVLRYKEDLVKIIGKEKYYLFEELDLYLKDDFYLDPIQKLEVVPCKSKFVYDITVENTHLFIPEGAFVISNCYDNEAYMNCLSTSSLILTKEGLKKITEVKVGDEVYALDQNTHQLVIKKCSGVFDNGRKEVFELKTLHHSIKATANHPFLVLKRNGRGRQNSLIWKTLEDIEISDRVVTLKSMNEDAEPDTMKYLGIFVDDAWRRKAREQIGSICVSKDQDVLIDNKFFQTEEVVSIKSKGIEPTLDLKVEDEHNFIADGIVVHNTGVQRSGLTPFRTYTTTSPVGSESLGNIRPKKNMPEIALAHGIPYVATCSAGFIQDLQRKVKKAISIKGPKYIQIHAYCPLGWRYELGSTLEVAKLAVETGLYPLIEYENGVLVARRAITPKPVEEYLKLQGRFKHLLNNPEAIRQIQEIADDNIKKYGLKVEGQQTS